MQADERVATELGRFGVAVEKRFGEEGVRQMLRARGRPGVVKLASIAPEQQPALDQVTRLTVVLKAGERAGENLARREAERAKEEKRRGLRM